MQPGGKHLLVIDLGGTNIRAAYAALDGDEIFAMEKLIYVEFWCGVVVKMRAA